MNRRNFLTGLSSLVAAGMLDRAPLTSPLKSFIPETVPLPFIQFGTIYGYAADLGRFIMSNEVLNDPDWWAIPFRDNNPHHYRVLTKFGPVTTYGPIDLQGNYDSLRSISCKAPTENHVK